MLVHLHQALAFHLAPDRVGVLDAAAHLVRVRDRVRDRVRVGVRVGVRVRVGLG